MDKFNIEFNDNRICLKTTEKITKSEAENLSDYNELSNLLNYLELYSVYYISGVSDENVWFHTTWNCYCEIVLKLFPLILVIGSETSYKNIKMLYNIWEAKVRNEKLEMEKDNIEKKIKEIDIVNIKPIWTKKI